MPTDPVTTSAACCWECRNGGHFCVDCEAQVPHGHICPTRGSAAHDVTVVESTAMAWAQCTCGWVGPSQPTKTKAELDAAQHRSDVEDDQ